MDVDTYLHRIRYTGPRTPTAETLHGLHQAHILNVPFENLDIHYGKTITMDESKFFEKIVLQRRGGFCYELNGLFAALLRQLNFDVTLLSARVYDDDSIGAEFDHMALLVQLEDRWLADVGFGDSFTDPLRFDDPAEQIQNGTEYRIVHEREIWTIMERRTGDEWKKMYRFDLLPRQLADYAAMCSWHQTSAASHFTQKRTCSMATPDGRVTLSGMKFIVTANGKRHEKMLADKDEYSRVLKTYFGMEIA